MLRQPRLVLDAKTDHGEGPVWDSRQACVFFVDILGRVVHQYYPGSGSHRTIALDDEPGCIAPCRDGGLIAALRGGFARIGPLSGQITRLSNPEADRPGNRFNDGKCDPAGRFWAGTCSENCDVPGAGSLYRLDPDGTVHRMIEEVSVSNGLAWSADSRTMYFIDTPTMEVSAFDFDPATGVISNRRTAVSIPNEEGFPDGMTIDAQDKLWVAHWGGARLCRWDPETGAKLDQIDFRERHVSACVFGGPNLDILYVTTSRQGLTEDQLREQPHAGGLYAVRPGVPGSPTHRFAGRPEQWSTDDATLF